MKEHLLPAHGTIRCRQCFQAGYAATLIGKKWQMRNDPGAYGSREPSILVLGFSKGATQTDIYSSGRFDEVAFGGRQSRKNLTDILRRVRLLRENETVDEKICAAEQEFAFGSLVRCSLARLDQKKGIYTTSGALIKKSFDEIPEILQTCAATYLKNLPARTHLVIMLGVDDGYIQKCKELLSNFYAADFRSINEVVYGTGERVWVHLTHPSPGNGTRGEWLHGGEETRSGHKRELALQVILGRGLHRA